MSETIAHISEYYIPPNERTVNVIIDEDYPVKQRHLWKHRIGTARKIRDELIRMTLEGEL